MYQTCDLIVLSAHVEMQRLRMHTKVHLGAAEDANRQTFRPFPALARYIGSGHSFSNSLTTAIGPIVDGQVSVLAVPKLPSIALKPNAA